MGKSKLLENVESQLSGADESQSEKVAHSVLYHLWRRMPAAERERLLNALPTDVKELMWERSSPAEPTMSDEDWKKEGSIDHDTFEAFCEKIRKETGLAGDGQDTTAIYAVFGALKSELPGDEAEHLHAMLPQGLKQAWATA